MRIIPQMNLFGYWGDENLGDLERLQTVIDYMPDEKIIHKLYKIRGRGRNDWPVEAMWNSFLASFVFEHRSVSDLLRELKRNRQLREMCGFEPKSMKKRGVSIKLLAAPHANWCMKEYTSSVNEKGEKVIKKVKWFGYRLHLIVDAEYELPVDYRLTKASCGEQTQLHGRLDRDYGFENHTIRGKEKMELFIGVTFLVGLATSKAKLEKGSKNHLACLVS